MHLWELLQATGKIITSSGAAAKDLLGESQSGEPKDNSQA